MSNQRYLSGTALKLFTFTLLTGTFTMSISQSALSTAYPTLMAYFDLSATTVQWLTTGFMLVMCVMMPISPWLLNNIPFKRLYMGILSLFTIGTLLIVFANQFGWVLFGRALEAIAVGVLFPSFQTVLLTITAENQRGQIMGLAGLVMGSALACGPIISGVILNYFSWRGLFIAFILIILTVLATANFTISDIMPAKPYHLDGLSVLCTTGLIGLLYVISSANHPTINPIGLWGIGLVSCLALGYFVYRQLTQTTPLLNLHILGYLNYDIAVGLTAISYISLIVTTVIYPLYFQAQLKLTPLLSGLALVPAAVVLSLLNPLAGRLADKIGFKPTLLVGLTMISIGWLALIGFYQWLSLPLMILCACFIEGGNAFVMMPAVTLGANSLPDQVLADGTAVTTTIRQIAGALGVTLATLLLSVAGYQVVFISLLGLTLIGLGLATQLHPK
ncbi:multidrug efflux MFS transporter [Latilactobacillus curvatus]|uniref:MFS transporter n=1 Tax=Latilactobacillus curvatus TaxID=28038 RepID=UPI00217D8177|nr:MFS transporter [Latilactobacillus curvatus]MCS6143521.1 multidrug efflux MFS transporter [Latilactobacillus curvatus]